MVRLKIDNLDVEIHEGATILEAAQTVGIAIPTLCYLEGHPPNTSCMVCVVKVGGRERLIPACAARAEEGMVVENRSEEVHEARKQALELLLSDHLGDCVAPCHRICPAGMNIPRMIREIACGAMDDAIRTVKADIPLPAVLGRICPAPCEKGCRRKQKDSPVSICLLKRYAADVDLASRTPFLPGCKPDRSEKVAIAGAGPAGLAAAYYLRQEGYGCTVFDDHDKPGGMLRYAVPEEKLSREVLDAEIALIEKLGVCFQPGTRIGDSPSLEDLRSDFDAVLLAFGRVNPEECASWSLDVGKQGIKADRRTRETSMPGVFAAGDAVHPKKLSVAAVAAGKDAAISIHQFLSGGPVTGPAPAYTTHVGSLKKGEIDTFMAGISTADRTVPAGDMLSGFVKEEARDEAARCLHCDCRKPDTCTLRIYAAEYGARPNRFGSGRRTFEQERNHPHLIYEPGKCISCGICIRIAASSSGDLGLAFKGRGFDVRVAVPFGGPLSEGLAGAGIECVAACPTGALALKKDQETPRADRDGRRTSSCR